MSDYEPPDIYREAMITARKPHRCCECDQKIAFGESYQRVTGLWDGSFDSFATCKSCAETRLALAIEAEYPCTWFGGLREAIEDFEAEFGPFNRTVTVPPETRP
jgi:hypothetical protein